MTEWLSSYLRRGIVIAVALVAVGVLTLPAAAASERRPVVRLIDERPLTVAGHGFARAERVTVKVVSDGAVYRKVVVASRAGRLTARWTNTVLPECSPYTVTATGAKGSRALLRRIQIPPACGIVLQP